MFEPTKDLVNPSQAEMRAHVAASDLVLSIWSPGYFRSKWCRAEAHEASNKAIPLIPVYNGDKYVQGAIIDGLDRRDAISNAVFSKNIVKVQDVQDTVVVTKRIKETIETHALHPVDARPAPAQKQLEFTEAPPATILHAAEAAVAQESSPKEALIELLIEVEKNKLQAAAHGADIDAEESSEVIQKLSNLRLELKYLKLSVLQKEAAAAGLWQTNLGDSTAGFELVDPVLANGRRLLATETSAQHDFRGGQSAGSTGRHFPEEDSDDSSSSDDDYGLDFTTLRSSSAGLLSFASEARKVRSTHYRLKTKLMPFVDLV